MRIKSLTYVLILVLSGIALFSRAQESQPLFKAGENGYSCFRIPAIIKSKHGDLLAFAEGRKAGCGDAGDIDLVLRRSSDNGKTWFDLQIVWSDGENTCGNPSPVLDEKTGRIILLSTWNLGADHESMIINQTSKDSRRIFKLYSDDDGQSWSNAEEITKDVKLGNWTWYATGPCNGIQLLHGEHKGRLVIPCDHIEAGTKKYFSHVVYSDDGGTHWKLGGTTPTDKVNESTVVELPKGKLLLNMRNYTNIRVRQNSISDDGGDNWSELYGDTTLIEPVCQASMIACRHRSNKGLLAFSNPADQKKRVNMTVRLSDDAGITWKQSQSIYAGPAAYSNMIELKDGSLACYFEAGVQTAYEGIFFKIVDKNLFK